MNKKFLFLIIFALSFFICTDVYASEKVGINYDANEHFNYFYEQKNNTGFYQFLQNHKMNFPSHILGYLPTGTQLVTDNFLIYYSKDLEPFLLEGKTFPADSKYVIVTLDEGNSTEYTSRYGKKYGYGQGENFNIPIPDSSSSSIGSFNLLFFDENGSYISKKSGADIISNINDFYFEIDGTSEESSAEFSYFISNIYYLGFTQLYGFTSEIIVTDIYFDNNHYIIDNNENYNSFVSWFRTFFTSAEKYDVSGTQLNYFRENKYYDGLNKPLSLYRIIQLDSNLTIPSGFTSINLKGANNYFFFPKNIDSKLLNRNFYTYLPDYVETDNASIGANIMDLKSGSYSYIGLDPDDTTSKRVYELKLKKPFTMYSVNFTDILNKYDSNKNYTDFGFVFVNRWSKVTPVLHYHPDAYNVCIYDSSSSSGCTYTDPYTGETITLSKDDLYEIASQVDSTGASVDIFSPSDEQLEYAKNNSELYDYDEDGNIKGFNITGIFKSIAVFFTSFVAIISSVFTYFTLLFNALPIEIRSLLYFLLVGGILIILFKFMRG